MNIGANMKGEKIKIKLGNKDIKDLINLESFELLQQINGADFCSFSTFERISLKIGNKLRVYNDDNLIFKGVLVEKGYGARLAIDNILETNYTFTGDYASKSQKNKK